MMMVYHGIKMVSYSWLAMTSNDDDSHTTINDDSHAISDISDDSHTNTNDGVCNDDSHTTISDDSHDSHTTRMMIVLLLE